MPAEDMPLYRLTDGVTFACSNVHNVDARKGRAGETSRFPHLKPGESVVVADLEGPAVITRFWLTFDWPSLSTYPRSMLRNRSMRLKVTWDNADAPAIDVPVGDFFGHPLCYDMPFENALFSDPTGRSSLCVIPMPFRERAVIELVNEFDTTVTVFHDIRLVRGVEPHPDDGYLHACFARTSPDKPGDDHDVLPRVHGKGRYLGTHLGVIPDRFNPLEWHGANLRVFLDGDDEYPSMMGASLDDVGGASWAFDLPYMHQDSGLLLSRVFPYGGGHFGMYFYHRRDPIYFSESCAVDLRPRVSFSGNDFLKLIDEHPGIIERLALPGSLDELKERARADADGWIDCGRQDDISSVAFYYLNEPAGHHSLAPQAERCQPAWQWPTDDANTLRTPEGHTFR